ncbi:MAG: carboxypeptidase regulatory-like domain-containing protein [Planctomycetes bacterium]|nr:carboxypeptidase regulatory-like domain-containing protein [Planctomycetota bacterium]
MVQAINRFADAWWPFVLHATWQASLLAVVVLAIVKLGKRWPSPIRYGLLVVCLVKFAIPPTLSFPTGLFSLVGPRAAPLVAPQSTIAEEPDIIHERLIVDSTSSERSAAARTAPATVTMPTAASMSWRSWLFLAQLAGALAVAGWLASRWIELRRASRLARTASVGPLHDRVVSLCRRLGMRRTPRILVSPSPVPPMAFGLVRPTILLPAVIAERDDVSIDAVVAHELAHHRRRDLWINSLQLLVSIVWWFNPVLWILNCAIRETREDACDDIVLARGVADGRGYGETLVAAAARLAQRDSSIATVACANRLHPLGRRLRRLLDDSLARRAGLSMAGGTVLVAVALLAIPGLRSIASDVSRTLDIHVVDARTSAPLPGAGIIIGQDMPWERLGGMTDSAGLCRLSLSPADATLFGVTARMPGFISRQTAWDSDEPPSTTTIALEPGTTMHGIVRDENERPVAGAVVHLYALYSYPGSTPDHLFRGCSVSAESDADGRWSCDELPATIAHLRVRLAHSDFVSDPDFNVRPEPNMATLRDGTAVFTMARGVPLSGTVCDSIGQPIAQASVRQGSEWWGTAFPTTRTDAGGRFEFPHCRSGELVLTAQADGFAPDLRTLTIASGGEPIAFRLRPGRTIRARVVDEEGRAVVAALVVAYRWRDKSSLAWYAHTDADGRVEWTSGPNDAVILDVMKAGYERPAIVRIESSNEERVVVLRRQTSADTAGAFPHDDSDGVVMSPISGVVKGPDGSPLADATVVACSFQRCSIVTDGRVSHVNDPKGGTHAVTDATGRFRLDAPDGPSIIVAFHDAGWAEARVSDIAASGIVVLRPWGRIEGTWRVGAHPAARDSICVRLDHDVDFGLGWETPAATADAEGRFVIERVPPGDVHVYRSVRTVSGKMLATQNHHVTVEPGSTTSVTVGGTGRPIVGRLRASAEVGDVDFSRDFQLSLLEPRHVPMGLPPAGLDARGKQEWRIAWHRSEEGRAYARETGTVYPIVSSRDGHFRIDDVPAGSYELNYWLQRKRPDGSGYDSLGELSRDVVVEDMPGGRSDDLLDLGDIEVPVYRTLNVGDVAPDFVAARFDGGSLRLEEFRGRHVLLVFWCGMDAPRVVDVCRSLAGESRLAIVGLVPDAIISSAEHPYAPPDQRNWTDARLGRWNRSPVRFDYGVRGGPAVFLIGPDGRILAKDLHSDAIAAAVAQALRGN